jgi:hypothetical protein
MLESTCLIVHYRQRKPAVPARAVFDTHLHLQVPIPRVVRTHTHEHGNGLGVGVGAGGPSVTHGLPVTCTTI